MRVRSVVLISAVTLTCLANAQAESDARFEDYFGEGTLRIDIIHAGGQSSESISIRQLIKEPVWSGPKNAIAANPQGPLSHAARLGKYRVDLVDRGTGRVIYQNGFGTLFGEWQTTEEARSVRRAFEETLEVPFPKNPVEIRVYSRDKTGEMKQVFVAPIDPRSHLIGRPPKFPEAEVYELEVSGDPSKKVDLLILGDGYTVEDKAKFEGDCRRFMHTFFQVEPFKRLRDRFNVRAVFAASTDSGIDEPRKGVYSDTPFGMTFSTFDLARYCMSEAVWAMHDYAASVPHDALLLMGNSSRYGGGAIYNYYTVFVSDNEYDDYLPVHEFGHGFAGLGDEYYTSAVAYSDFYPQGVEPWEPNITALIEPDHLKWKAFVDPDTPLPTPEDDPRFADKVGAFEGAGYAAKNLFRPQKDCKMFSKGNKAFCRVCEQAMVDMIRHYAPD